MPGLRNSNKLFDKNATLKLLPSPTLVLSSSQACPERRVHGHAHDERQRGHLLAGRDGHVGAQGGVRQQRQAVGVREVRGVRGPVGQAHVQERAGRGDVAHVLEKGFHFRVGAS